jgi:hypothetical protein
MLPIRIVLVDTTGTVAADTMVAAATALNVQVTRDLPPFWGVSATVSYGPDPNSIPQGMWPVQIVDALPGNEGGYHQTYLGQPYAKVLNTPGSDEWTIDASHETIEMLVDPYGNRLYASTAIWIGNNGQIVDVGGKFEYLVEACDPCEANHLAYSIDGIWVSDFVTPSFYDPVATPNARYSFTGAITAPRQILPGGYISWLDPQSDQLMQILWVNQGAPPQLKNLGLPPPNMSLRAFVEASTHPVVRYYRPGATAELVGARKAYRANLAAAARARARHYI